MLFMNAIKNIIDKPEATADSINQNLMLSLTKLLVIEPIME